MNYFSCDFNFGLWAQSHLGLFLVRVSHMYSGLWEYIYREVLYLSWLGIARLLLVQDEFSQYLVSLRFQRHVECIWTPCPHVAQPRAGGLPDLMLL